MAISARKAASGVDLSRRWAPIRAAAPCGAAPACDPPVLHQSSIFRLKVSGRNNNPITTVAAQIATGYHNPK
jgi:hypothetical protein